MRLIRETFLYGVGEAILRILSVVLFTRILIPADYGVLGLGSTLASLAASFLVLGGDSAYARFFFRQQDPAYRRLVTSTWLGFLAVFSALGTMLMLPLAWPLSTTLTEDRGHGTTFALALLGVPVLIGSRMLAQALRNQFRPGWYVTTNLLGGFLTVILAVFLVHSQGLGTAGYFVAVLLAEVIVLPVRLFLVRELLGWYFSPGLLKELLKYGIPLVPVSLSYWVFLTVDRFLLAKLATLDSVGLYAVANNIVGILLLAHTAVGQAWTPYAVRLYEERGDEASPLFGRALTYILLLIGSLAVLLTAFAEAVVVVVSNSDYRQAADAVGPLALALLALASTNVTAMGLSLTDRTKYIAKYSFFAALANIALCLVLIPHFDMVGAAWASTGAYTLLTVLYLQRSRRYWPILYERKASLVVVGLTSVFVAITMVLPDLDTPGYAASRAVACIAYVLSLVATGAVGRREVELVRGLFTRA